MAETTDEIRKKINDFFAQVKDGGPGGREKSPPTQRLAKRKARWTGTLPARGEAKSSSGAFPTSFAPPAAHSRRDTPEVAPPRASARTPAPEGEKMDLRTALEKLRRHGVVKGDERAAPEPVVAPVDETPPRVAPPRRESSPVAPPRREPAPVEPPRRNPTPVASAPPALEPVRRPSPLKKEPPARKEPPPPAAPRVEPRPMPRPASPADVVDRRPPRAQPAAAQPQAPAPKSDPGAGFDSIFKEVEGIVLDTLKAKPDAAPADAPRAAETDEPPTLREQAPISEPVSQLVVLNEDSEEDEQAPPPRTAASARAPQFAQPAEDSEEEPEDEAPPAPYDWGVKPAKRPKGAWLLDAPDPPVAQEEPPAADASKPAAPAESDGSSSMRGARNFLVRKASDEVQRFKPVIKALKDASVLEAKDIDGESKSAGDDGFLSADSFNDDVPRGADVEAELSPMRLVEELRRIKRVTKALMAKGVISQKDMEKTDGD